METKIIRGVLRTIKENKVLVLILIIGILVRIFAFGNIPPGLNQDEASLGYDSYSLLNYGIDRNGMHNPVMLISWGSGMNALAAYIMMPFIKIFGLNVYSVRLVNLLFGILSLFIFFLVVKKIFNKEAAVVSTFLLAICPWHIMISRWALESNLFPSFFLLGVYFMLLSLEKKIYLPLSFSLFALSLYTYGTAYFIVPLFVLIATIYLISR